MSRADERVNFVNPLHSDTHHNDKQRTKSVVWPIRKWQSPENRAKAARITLFWPSSSFALLQPWYKKEKVSIYGHKLVQGEGPRAPTKYNNSNSHVDSWKRGREYVNVGETRRNDKRGVFGVWYKARKITVVLGSPAAVMALNLFLVEKFQDHYV